METYTIHTLREKDLPLQMGKIEFSAKIIKTYLWQVSTTFLFFKQIKQQQKSWN